VEGSKHPNVSGAEPRFDGELPGAVVSYDPLQLAL